jgi:hypothetical protein
MGLFGAAIGVTWSVMARPKDVYITREVASSFNLQTGPAPARTLAAAAPGETLSDAVAAAPPSASSLMRPIAAEGTAYGAAKASASISSAALERLPRRITAKAEAWARKHRLMGGLVTRPAAFLMSRSSLGSPRDLRAFLADPKKVDQYMNSALVRVALNSPTVAKALLGNPTVIRAVLATPAMRDPQAVKALLASPMFQKMLDCPAIQKALGDPAVMQKMVSDPQTIIWVAGHPDVLMAIAQTAPALGQALSR